MAAEVIEITGKKHERIAYIPPTNGLFFALHDTYDDSDVILLARCMPKGSGTDIYLFPEPDEGFEEQEFGEETIASYCIEDNFAVHLEHGDGCYVSMQNREGQPFEMIIGHKAIMVMN